MGPEDYSDEDTEGMLEECQLLEPDKERELDVEILKTHLETLLLLCSTREGRDRLREVKVYPIVRECHLKVEDEGVREGCDRVVQILMRGEEGDEDPALKAREEARIKEIEDEVDEDELMVEVA